MAKIRVVVGGAVCEAEGDERACSEMLKQFHLAVAQEALRDIENKLAALKPLQKQRRDLIDSIENMKAGRDPAL